MIRDNDEELQKRLYSMAKEKSRNDTYVSGLNYKYQSAFMGGSHYGAIRMADTPDRYAGGNMEATPVPVPVQNLSYSEETLRGGSSNYIPGSSGYAFGTHRDTGFDQTMGFKGGSQPKMTMTQLEQMGRSVQVKPMLNSGRNGSSLSGFGRPGRPPGSKNKPKLCGGAGETEDTPPPPVVQPKGTVGYEKTLSIKNAYFQRGKKAQAIIERYLKAKKDGANTVVAGSKPLLGKRMVGGVLPLFAIGSFLGQVFGSDIIEGLLSPDKQRAVQKAIDDARAEGKAEGMAEGLATAEKARIYSSAKEARMKQKIAEAPESENAQHLVEEIQADKAKEADIKQQAKVAKSEIVSGSGKKVDGRVVRGQAIAKLMREKKLTFGQASKEYSKLKGAGLFSSIAKIGSKALKVGQSVAKSAVKVAKGVKKVYDDLPEETKKDIKKVGKKAVKKLLEPKQEEKYESETDKEAEESEKSVSESDIKPKKTGAGKNRRGLNPKMVRRMALVKKIMKKEGLSMIESSKFIKANNLKY
jgi:hypothetical protein